MFEVIVGLALLPVAALVVLTILASVVAVFLGIFRWCGGERS